MLELLVKYTTGSEPGFSPKFVRWAINFDSKAGFTGIIELGQPEQKRKPGLEFKKCPDLTQPELVSGPSPRSHFLVETASVVAKYEVEATDTKNLQKHEFFVHMLSEAGKTIPQLATIARFMKDENTLARIRQDMELNKVRSNDKVTFRLNGEFPVEKDYWHDWWRSFRRSLIGPKKQFGESGRFRCFATGELVTPADTHPKIRGLAKVGGRPSGDVLVGFDKMAYRSYGLEQSVNAAVSEEAAKAYTSSLNQLIQSYGQVLANAITVHWFKDKVAPEDDPVAFLTEAAEVKELDAQERARELLRSLETGKRPDLAGNRYYILTISGAAGRVMVRDWLEGEFEELVRNVNQWFDDLQMVKDDGTTIAKPPRFQRVLGALTSDLRELPPPLASKLWRAAVCGEEIPYHVLALSISRRKVESLQNEKLDVYGMGIIRVYHLRKYRKEENKLAEELTPKLKKDFPDVAYQCGRLMATMAELQRDALGDVGAGVVQRYYSAASTAPALVLGRLTSYSQHHLSKLEANQPHLASRYENTISEIWSHIKGPLPRTLTLEEQSLFALGYYHQLASLKADKSRK